MLKELSEIKVFITKIIDVLEVDEKSVLSLATIVLTDDIKEMVEIPEDGGIPYKVYVDQRTNLVYDVLVFEILEGRAAFMVNTKYL